MTTTIRDLLSLLEAEVSVAANSTDRAADAVQSRRHIGRALRALAIDGLDETVPDARENLTHDLADALTATAAAGAGERSGRASALAGAVADSITVIRGELGREQRWALTAGIAHTARTMAVHLISADTSYPPPPALDWAYFAARAIGSRAVFDTALPTAGRALDRAIPTTVLTADLRPTRVAAEALTVLSHRLTVAAPTPVTLLELFAATRAAESTARYAVAAVALLRDRPIPTIHPAPAAWRAVRAGLQPFTTAASTDQGAGTLADWARLAHVGLRRGLGEPAAVGVGLTDLAIGHLQPMTNELPGIAGALTTMLNRMADAGDLHALATRLPYRADRLDQHLHRRPIIADRRDLADLTRTLTSAGDHSAELAVALYQTRAGAGDQPGLIAAHAERARTAAHHTQAPAIRWAALAAAVDPRIIDDPHWATLAEQMQRIHASGEDLPTLLTQVIAARALPDHHPARSLDYRLNDSAPHNIARHQPSDHPTGPATPSRSAPTIAVSAREPRNRRTP